MRVNFHRCWWRMLETKCVGDKCEMLVTDSRGSWHEKITNITKIVANMMILTSTSEISHHHKVTNIMILPTSLSALQVRKRLMLLKSLSWWQWVGDIDVGDFMIMILLRDWQQNHYFGDCFNFVSDILVMLSNCHQHLKLANKVPNIFSLQHSFECLFRWPHHQDRSTMSQYIPSLTSVNNIAFWRSRTLFGRKVIFRQHRGYIIDRERFADSFEIVHFHWSPNKSLSTD